MGVRFGAVDSNTGEESVEVVVHALAVFRRNHCELASSDARLFLHLDGLVVVGDPALGTHTAPVAEDSVPYCDVLHIRVALSYLRGELLQTIWKSSLIGFEVGPCPLKLCLTGGQGLPVVVDNEVCDVDVFFGQGVERLRHFFGREVLTQAIPGALLL